MSTAKIATVTMDGSPSPSLKGGGGSPKSGSGGERGTVGSFKADAQSELDAKKKTLSDLEEKQDTMAKAERKDAKARRQAKVEEGAGIARSPSPSKPSKAASKEGGGGKKDKKGGGGGGVSPKVDWKVMKKAYKKMEADAGDPPG